MWRRWSISLTHEGVYYLIVLAFIGGGAILREINLLVVLAGMMVSLLLISFAVVLFNLARLSIVRHVPRHVVAGERFFIRIGLANKGYWTRWGIAARDGLAGGAGLAAWQENSQVEVFFGQVRPGDSSVRTYEGRLEEPGRYRLGPLVLATGFPLGLIRFWRPMEARGELLVLPRTGRIHPVWLRELASRADSGHRSHTRRSRAEGDFYGLRDWQPGDSRRWIHWRTSARYGSLTVREFEQQESRDLAVLVIPAGFGKDPAAAFAAHRLTLSFAATLLKHWSQSGSARLLLATAGEEVHTAQGRSSAGLLGEFMEQLAVLPPLDKAPIAELFLQSLPLIPRGSRTVLVTGRPLDLRQTPELAPLWRDPAMAARLEAITVVDASATELSSYFFLDGAAAESPAPSKPVAAGV